ncbi:MAG: adenosylmethionine decarboxylase [Calditrichota bacterium]
MKALGRQIVVEYYGCNPDILNDVAFIKRAMRDAALASGATIVQEAFHLFNPHGVSGVVVIAESHLTIHTWPEYGYAAVDLFTCGEDVSPDAAFNYLKEHLEAQSFSAMEMKRGILNAGNGAPIRHKPERMLAEA